jgi:hypothetical protein
MATTMRRTGRMRIQTTGRRRIHHEPTQCYKEVVMQMTMTLHLEVVIMCNTAALKLLQVIPRHLEDIDIVMIGVNTIVDTALHLEVVTTDCSDINVKMIVVVVVMRWVVEEHGLEEDNMRREMIVTPVVTIHHPHQVKMIVALDQEVESNYAVGITGDGTRKRMMPIRKKSDVIQKSSSRAEEECGR